MTFRTKIYLYTRESRRENGITVNAPADHPFASVWCRWKGAFGNQAIQAYEQGITDLATVTFRWSAYICGLLDGTCFVSKDGKMYEIITEPSDIDDARLCVEFKVRRWCSG